MSLRLRNTLLSFAGIVVILGIARGLDIWIYRLLIESRATFNVAPLWWAVSLSKFLVMFLSVFLAWFTLCKNPANILSAVLFIVVGSSCLFYNIVLYYTGPHKSLSHLDFNSLFVNAGAFLAALGVFALLSPLLGLNRRTEKFMGNSYE